MTQLLAAAVALAMAASTPDDSGTAQPSPHSNPPAAAPETNASPLQSPSPATALASTPLETGPLSDRSLIGEDIDPTVKLVSTDRLEMRIGGLVQLQTALYAGEHALVDNGDFATRAGFRLRRARLGLEGRIGQNLGVLLAVNALESDREVGTVADAKLTWAFAPWLGVAAGTGKVPFSRSALQSSRTLLSLERPLSVSQITPSRRLGFTAEGQVLEGRIGYVAGVMNATEGFSRGNQFGGFLYGARLEFSPFTRPLAGQVGTSGVAIGASAFRDEGSAIRRDAFSVDLLAAFRGASLQLEALCDRASPTIAPVPATELLANTERCGAYGEAGYALLVRSLPLQVTARAEVFDDNRVLQDAGDVLLLSGGVNVDVFGDHARAQLQYVMRRERFGIQRDNDGLVVGLQGSF